MRALLDHVPPTLRNASIELKDEVIHWKCQFDANATEDDIELLSCAGTEIIADFSEFGLKESLTVVPFPEKCVSLKNIVYHRHEHDYFID
ncbi:MAG: hypothetical protein AAF740_02000 [Bacteroidota bacterium]